MPFSQLTQLEVPPDDSTIFRYIDFWKLREILSRRSLFFVRSDKFVDPWDSVLPAHWSEGLKGPMVPRLGGGHYTFAEWYEEREIPSNLISCWTIGEKECEEMWRNYTCNQDSVVIQTNVGCLKECFRDSPLKILMGKVHYGEHVTLPNAKVAKAIWGDEIKEVGPNPWYVPRFFKLRKFEWEQEIRLTVHVNCEAGPIDVGFNVWIGDWGVKKLIQSIRTHPNSNQQFADTLQKTLAQNGFGDVVVKRSDLMRI